MAKHSKMYKDTETWNPFMGCWFTCRYCIPTFMWQAKRQKKNCMACYNFEPHYHPERLTKIPNAKIVFVAGYGDISFCDPDYTRRIIKSIKEHNKKKPDKEYYFQTKQPECLEQFIGEFPDNVILVTTLETNNDHKYEWISRAPKPSIRYQQFKALDYPRKVVTIEPIMAFHCRFPDDFGKTDAYEYCDWIEALNPEYVWIGGNSKPNEVKLPEPRRKDLEWVLMLFDRRGIEYRLK